MRILTRRRSEVLGSTRPLPALARQLAAIVGERAVLHDPYDLRLYQYDGSIDTALPEAVVFPATTEEVAGIVRLCVAEGIKYTPRGAGTGLSGGAVPVEGGIVISLARMTRIVEVDVANLRAVVEPGVVNLHLSQHVAPLGLYFVPDPSSQKACTIGGNVGENSGGPHTLAYGVMTNHTLGLEVVLPDGEVVWTGGKALDTPGYDLTGLLVGSEGTMGIVTKAIVRLVPLPEQVKTLLGIFDTVERAGQAVSDIIAARIVPQAIEMMDGLAIQAVEASVHAGYPLDAGAVLLLEIEGFAEGLDELAGRIADTCRRAGALDVRVAKSEEERQLLWKGRKGAFGAIGRISPDYYTMDGVVPRSAIARVLTGIAEIAARYGLRVANVFHAGDGNLHPLLLFDATDPEETARVRECGAEILRLCAEAGGSLSGEHGIGVEKRDLMDLVFSAEDMRTMREVRAVFDPRDLCNPGKIFPTPGRCINPASHRGKTFGW